MVRLPEAKEAKDSINRLIDYGKKEILLKSETLEKCYTTKPKKRPRGYIFFARL